jgi:cytochrome c551/c552
MFNLNALCSTSLVALGLLVASVPGAAQRPAGETDLPLFATSNSCLACHRDLTTPHGEDVSIARHWQASMMGNAARDPYWQAAVRREVRDHATAQAVIEDECSICHMPMMRMEAKRAGHEGRIFAQLPIGGVQTAEAGLAADGVSCTVCHQITTDKLGTPASFVGGFHVATSSPPEGRPVYGPFEVDRGRRRIMRSSSGFVPAAATHLGSSEMCATCHTLITQAFGPNGEVVGELPEQVPYQEWEHSDYARTRSCQACHMPEVAEPTPITTTLGQPRPNLSRHGFQGGNFLMPRLLNRFRGELGVTSGAADLAGAADRAVVHLRDETAAVTIEAPALRDGTLAAEVIVTNRAGHKLPTAYPSRRAWLHIVVRDARDRVVFESGRMEPDGRISGNDNDADPHAVEPHREEIAAPEDVQIYEAVMVDRAGVITTGLLSAVAYTKDNRLLPLGFDKATASAQVAVHGGAREDADFGAGHDRVRLRIPVSGSPAAPYRLQVALRYQPIAFRWARNLGEVDAIEAKRFTQYYEEMAPASSVVLALAEAVVGTARH